MTSCILLSGGGLLSPSPQTRSSEVDPDRLLDAARAGDAHATGRLLDAHRPFIENYISRRARSRDDADDLVQNVFLRAARNISSFRSDCPFSQWLLRIAANELKNYYERVLGRQASVFSEFDEEISEIPQRADGQLGPYQEAEEKIAVEDILAMARQACGKDEFMILTMFYQGETLDEIAGLLDMKGATVRSHFLRARGKLLAHAVANRPEFLGGADAISTATSRLAEQEGLNAKEAEAMERRDCRSEAFRAACIKVARYLPAPLILVFLGRFL